MNERDDDKTRFRERLDDCLNGPRPVVLERNVSSIIKERVTSSRGKENWTKSLDSSYHSHAHVLPVDVG